VSEKRVYPGKFHSKNTTTRNVKQLMVGQPEKSNEVCAALWPFSAIVEIAEFVQLLFSNDL